jgi:hypothetical protein
LVLKNDFNDLFGYLYSEEAYGDAQDTPEEAARKFKMWTVDFMC